MSALAGLAVAMLVAVLVGNTVRLPLLAAGGKSAPLLPLDVVVLAFVALGVVEAWRQRRFVVERVTAAGGLFLAIAGIALVTAGARVGLSVRDLLFGGAYLARWALYFGVYVMASAFLTARDAIGVVRTLRLVIGIFAALGILQVLFLPGFAQLLFPDSVLYQDWDPQGRRLVSTFLDPNYAGILLVIGLTVWGGSYLAGAKASGWEGLLLGTALILTLSRGSALAAVAAGATLLVSRGPTVRSARLLLAALLLMVLAAPVLVPYASTYDKLMVDGSALQRLLAWQKVLILIGDYPWLGVGFNTVGFVARRYGWMAQGSSAFGLDGGLLFIAALTGVIGLSAFLLLLWVLARSSWRSWEALSWSPEARGVALAVPASIVAVTVQATFANTLLMSLVLAPCWLLWAMPRALRRNPPGLPTGVP